MTHYAANGFVSTLFLFSLALPLGAGAEALSATQLWYVEQERGIEPYRVRYLVTPRYLRSDEGEDEGAYTLFDRQTHQIYSVVPANRSVLHIDGRGDTAPKPESLVIGVERRTEDTAPVVGGQPPLRLDLKANGELCQSAMVAPGLFADVEQAMRDFARALSVQQSRTLDNTPVEYQTPCFLARYLHAGDFHWQLGTVLVEWDTRGGRRELIDYTQGVAVPEALFDVPAQYRVLEGAGAR